MYVRDQVRTMESLRTTPSLILAILGLYISHIQKLSFYLRLGISKGFHELHKNEFENFLKSDDSALESLELLSLKSFSTR